MKKLKLYTRSLIPLFAILGLLLPSPLLLAAPSVVASIKPIHSLIAGIMQGVGEPSLLIRGGQSPHDFSLRPSDMHLLRRADLVVWVGPDVEASLARLFEKNPLNGEVLKLTQLQGITWLAPREEAEWEARHAKQSGAAHREHSHDGGIDSHIWLSPNIARHIVRRISVLLSELDKANAARYQSNAQQLIERLNRLDKELAAVLSPVQKIPYIVFHDAYHYFEQHYDLHAVGSVSVSPERLPGARHIHELRSKIIRLDARCVFAEPQFQPKLVNTLIKGTSARAGELDPLGSELEPGPEAYFQLMRGLAGNLLSCLQSRR
ncbi:MAG: zinc ABC transporter substrate-binding protein [Chromatiales bacterium]|jgi:zinc transport system substrate-binding protein